MGWVVTGVDIVESNAVVTVADDRVETFESADVEEYIPSAEGSDIVSSDTTIEVTPETLTGNEDIWVIGPGDAEE